jgi:hypothetical protein
MNPEITTATTSIMFSLNCVYRLLRLRTADPDRYAREIAFGEGCAANWDEPE